MKKRELWTIFEAIEANGGPLRISKAGAYKYCAEGTIPSVRIGKKVFIPNSYVQSILNYGENI